MTIEPIINDEQHQAALAEISTLMYSEKGTTQGDRLNELADAIEAYEAVRYPFELPTPIEAIRFSMDAAGLTNEDLVPLIGSTQLVEDVLSGAHQISEEMARKINQGLLIPIDVLMQKHG